MKGLAIATSIVLLATAAWAQKKETGNPSFDAFDKNGDGFLSKAEVDGNKELAKRFQKFDANKDGRWSVDEYVKANQDNDARILADTAFTTKVKAALLTEKGIPSTDISVQTYEGTVMLSGFVASAEVKDKAGTVAKGVSGAKAVLNNLSVK